MTWGGGLGATWRGDGAKETYVAVKWDRWSSGEESGATFFTHTFGVNLWDPQPHHHRLLPSAYEPVL